MEDVTDMDLTGDVKIVRVGEDEYKGRAVILAMGAAARYLGIPGEQEYLGRGVSSCATCDGFFFRDKPIVVVGGGDSAMEEATFLTKFGSSVTIVHRREEFRLQDHAERARANEKISFILNTTVDEVLAGENGSVEKLRLRNTVTGETSELGPPAMFVAIGHDPRSSSCATSSRWTRTLRPHRADHRHLHPRRLACGDLVDHRYRQAVTAAGSASASIDAERWLAEQA